MANPFDQFDVAPGTAPKAAGSNPFDQFDATAANPFDQFDHDAGDYALGIAQRNVGGVASGMGGVVRAAGEAPEAFGINLGGLLGMAGAANVTGGPYAQHAAMRNAIRDTERAQAVQGANPNAVTQLGMTIGDIGKEYTKSGRENAYVAEPVRAEGDGAMMSALKSPLQAAKYYGTEALGSAVPTAVALVAPEVSLPAMGLLAGGGEYGEAREKGQGVGQALASGAVKGALEVATEKLPLDLALGRVGGEVLKGAVARPAVTGLAEGGTEAVNAAVGLLYDKYVNGEPIAWDKISNEVQQAFLTGAFMGGGMGAAGVGLEKAAAAAQPGALPAGALGMPASLDQGPRTALGAGPGNQVVNAADVEAALNAGDGIVAPAAAPAMLALTDETARHGMQYEGTPGVTVGQPQIVERPAFATDVTPPPVLGMPDLRNDPRYRLGLPAPPDFVVGAEGVARRPGEPAMLGLPAPGKATKAAPAPAPAALPPAKLTPEDARREGVDSRIPSLFDPAPAVPARRVAPSVKSAPAALPEGIPPIPNLRGRKVSAASFTEEHHDILDFAALNGGLDRKAWSAEFGVDPAEWNSAKAQRGNRRFGPYGPPVFRKDGGLMPDQFRERAQAAGFVPADRADATSTVSFDDTGQLVMSALNQGDRVMTPRGHEAQAQIALAHAGPDDSYTAATDTDYNAAIAADLGMSPDMLAELSARAPAESVPQAGMSAADVAEARSLRTLAAMAFGYGISEADAFSAVGAGSGPRAAEAFWTIIKARKSRGTDTGTETGNRSADVRGAAEAGRSGDAASTGEEGAGEPTGRAFSRVAEGRAGRGVTVEQARARIERRFGRPVRELIKSGKLRIVQSAEDLPDGEPLSSDDGLLQGAHDRDAGVSYVVADSVTVANAAAVALHELGVHGGLAKVLGEAGVAKFAKQLRFIGQTGSAKEKALVAEALTRGDAQASDEELLAHAIELAEAGRADGSLSNRIRLWVDGLVSAIKAALFARGLIGANRLTLRDMRYLAEGSLRWKAKAPQAKTDVAEESPQAEPDYAAVADRILEMAQDDAMFALPRIPDDLTRMEDIVAQALPGAEVFSPDEEQRNERGAALDWIVMVPAAGNADEYAFTVSDHDGQVSIDVSNVGSGGFGSRVYNAVAAYAHNNGKVFVEDPRGLSDVAMRRRNENMLSSALKYGTTQHLAPGKRQLAGAPDIGVPPLQWREGDDTFNIAALLRNSIESMENADPEVRNIRYDFSAGTYYDAKTNEPYDDGALDERARSGRIRGTQAGGRTLKRHVWQSEILRRQGSEAGRGLLDGLGEFGANDASRPERIYYSRLTGQTAAARTKAKNKVASLGSAGYPTTGMPGWALSKGVWNKSTLTGKARELRKRLQDRMIAVRDVQEDIENAGNTIDELSDVYTIENLMHGRTGDRIKQMERALVEPLTKAMAKAGVEVKDVEQYLYAIHAPVRNAKVRAIDPNNTEGSGMSDADAAKVLSDFASAGKSAELARIAGMVRKVIDQTRENLHDDGLISDEVYKTLKADATYVPLRGEGLAGAAAGEASLPGASQGLDVRGSEVRRALGRHTPAVNILGEIIGDAHRAIIRSEKNRVGQSLLCLALQYPNKDVWEVERIKTKKAIDPQSGLVYDKVVEEVHDDSSFFTKVEGKEYKITLTHKELATAMKNLNADQIGSFAAMLLKVSRFMSAVYTTYSPQFALLNPLRDVLQATAVLGSEKLSVKDALKNWRKARSAMRADVVGKPAGNKLVFKDAGEAKRWAQYAREFSASGAKTGYTGMLPVEEYVTDLEAEIKREKGGAGQVAQKAFRGALEWVDHVNEANENATRLAVYSMLRNAGRSEQWAAKYAKNVTVNFNRRGTWSTNAGAWFLFFNAASQGVHSVARMMKNPRFVGGLGALFMMQFTIALSQLFDEDDDGENQWSKLDKSTKDRSLILWVGKDGKKFALPMPYGLSFASSFGGKTAEMVHAAVTKGKQIDGSVVAADVITGFLNAFSPVQADTVVQLAMPDAMDPLLDVALNKTTFGKSIHPDSAFAKYDKPKSVDYWPGTSEIWVAMAKGLNVVGGGSQYEKPIAGFDWSPNDLEYIAQQYLGGPMKTFNDMASMATSWQDNRTGEILGKLPAIKQVYGGGEPSRPTAAAYKAKVQDMERWEKAMRTALADGTDPELVRAQHPVETDGLYMGKMPNGDIKTVYQPGTIGYDYFLAGKEIDLIQDGINSWQTAKGVPAAEVRTQVRALLDRKERVQREFNRRFNEREKQILH